MTAVALSDTSRTEEIAHIILTALYPESFLYIRWRAV